ncbi:MAG: hypothetical protein OXM54_13820 [Acidimicrobiaceae bacterium]|nr:hypothetical protein [Acidimicrobiaceae bacterium]
MTSLDDRYSGQVPWWWEAVDPNRTGVSGDFAKEFKNETVKEPGVFAADHIPAEASLLVREAIQNSWDAARERYAETAQQQEGGSEPFAIRFRFREITDTRRDSFCDQMGLIDLAERITEMRHTSGKNPRGDLGLSEQDCLTNLYDSQSLRVLHLLEEHGGGMDGPWQGGRSKLWRAMCSLGMTRETAGHGGSYGYGKAGLIRGSAIRTVFAYTCFREHPDDPGVTRRLLGMTYWGSHGLRGSDYTGTRWFGQPTRDGGRMPFANEDADEMARRLGIETRDSSQPAQLGTTLVVLDPTVTPDDVLRAAERHWWPALEDDDIDFSVSVVDESSADDERHPQPSRNPDLKPFIDSYERALSPPDVSPADSDRWRVHQLSPVPTFGKPGTLALIADGSDSDNWTLPDIGANGGEKDGDSWEHRSLVALVRGPRMVVEYWDKRRASPYVRGTFVAAPEVDDAFRATEPKAHDAWHDDWVSGDVPEEAAKLARTVLNAILRHVDRFRRHLKLTPPPNRELKMDVWDDLARMLDGAGRGGDPTPPPPAAPRYFSIQPGGKLAADPDGRVHYAGIATVGWNEDHLPQDADTVAVDVRVRFNFDGADRKEAVRAEMEVEAPSGFVEVDPGSGRFRGRIAVDESASFQYLSESYDPEWTGTLTVEAEVVESAAATSGFGDEGQ